jgi:PIN domain nuclease of toxin-antitoxin system
MRVLLDTHALLWFALDDPQLSPAARAAILDPANDKLVSPASWWEIGIKMSTGKYTLTVPHDVFFDSAIAANGFLVLPIEPRHTGGLIGLPFHHKDPFDRLLIAQAVVEGIPVVSADAAFDPYPVRRVW